MYSDYRSLFSNFMWLWISPLFSPSSIHNCFVTAQAGCPFHFLGVSMHVCKLCQCAFFFSFVHHKCYIGLAWHHPVLTWE